MQTPEDLAAGWARGAVVLIQQAEGGPITIRPAAFVFATPTGIAWVEPGYADPAGSPSPALHYRDGETTAAADLLVLQAGAERVEARAYEDDDAADVGDALDWFDGYLQANGRTWAEERERVRALVNPASE